VTVGDSGDGAGDLACTSPELTGPATDPSSEIRSRFWGASVSSDDGSDVDLDEAAPMESLSSLRYLCRSPTPVSGRDLQWSSGESQRAARRLHPQRIQREAARVLTSPTEDLTEVCDDVSVVLMNQKKCKQVVHPVFEPSVFPDDGKGGWTLVCRRRRAPVITRPEDAQVPCGSRNSNQRASGPGMHSSGPVMAGPVK
jgi:hypothetical protein